MGDPSLRPKRGCGADDAGIERVIPSMIPSIISSVIPSMIPSVIPSVTRSIIPSIMASVDPQEKWWLRLRGNPKRLGEVSQAAFLLKAEMLGLNLALPWGDSERYDFVVWPEDGRVIRVQVKGTGRLHANGYEVQAVHTARGGRKTRYTKKEIDVIAAHVQPLDAWYLIPIEEIGRAKCLRFRPEGRGAGGSTGRDWEQWRDAWEVVGGRK